ncbi:hypothetical protein [Saccharopolyspora hattusasensis]|uniref:hypothetical protein n=1 Tax=Saccharopolyspora hattusasensis TaxID=1128679 RepID=UPI003D98F486
MAMYAKGPRQVDLLSEYLCLYRICEWADHGNGKSFINKNVDAIATRDFGELLMYHHTTTSERPSLNVFEAYRDRAIASYMNNELRYSLENVVEDKLCSTTPARTTSRGACSTPPVCRNRPTPPVPMRPKVLAGPARTGVLGGRT